MIQTGEVEKWYTSVARVKGGLPYLLLFPVIIVVKPFSSFSYTYLDLAGRISHSRT